ncbi:hypothetical protein IWX46DRAFT_585043 [Phyllosticta citricarpa]|uniref:Uncharacterized protein n=1 Tax=Phyllosticta citricarpa TaxID=55181 RepID=A0ABR1L9C6_9PEZI
MPSTPLLISPPPQLHDIDRISKSCTSRSENHDKEPIVAAATPTKQSAPRTTHQAAGPSKCTEDETTCRRRRRRCRARDTDQDANRTQPAILAELRTGRPGLRKTACLLGSWPLRAAARFAPTRLARPGQKLPDQTAAQFESLLHPTFSAREPISPPWECACLPPIPALPDRIKIQTLPSTQIVCIRGVGLGLDKWGGGGSGCNGRIVGHSRWHSQTRPHAATRLERRSGSWTWWSCRVEGGEMRRGDFELRCRGQDYMWEGFCVWLVYLRLESGTSEYHGRFPYQQLRRGPQDQRQIAVGRQTQQRPPSPKYLNPAKLDPLDDSVLCLTFLADVLAPRLERRGRRCRKCGDLAARGPRPTARIHQRRGKPLTLVFSEYTAAPRLKRSGRWQRDIDAEASGAAADSGAFVKGEDSGVSRSQWRRLELPASNVSMELEKEEKFQASFGVVVELVGAKQQTVSLQSTTPMDEITVAVAAL